MLFTFSTELLPIKTDSDLDPKFVCWILALFPTPWILIHLISADLMASIFFCCGICAVIRYASIPDSTPVVLPALFLSFAIWTKINSLLYTALVPLLWFALAQNQTFKEKVKRAALQSLLVLLFLMPLFIRNFVAVGDPLYPALKNMFPGSRWSQQQQQALRLDSFSKRENIASSILKDTISTYSPKRFFRCCRRSGSRIHFWCVDLCFFTKEFSF